MNTTNRIFAFLLLSLGWACSPKVTLLTSVQPTVETQEVDSRGDAADDSAIFVHPITPALSTIIATDKQRGLMVYDLYGRLLYDYPVGRINNVDLRTGFLWEGRRITLLAGSNRTTNSLSLWEVDHDSRQLLQLGTVDFPSKMSEVYGCTMYHDAETDTYYVFLSGKRGEVEQWLVQDNGGVIDARIVRSFDVGGVCEGMVADDEMGVLYVAEEDKGIFKFAAKPEADAKGSRVDLVRKNEALADDIEGLALFTLPRGRGYLIASSQGSSTFAVYERRKRNRYLGSFRISKGSIDETSATDGIAVTSSAMYPLFPNGVFVAQDDENISIDGKKERQNFKLVPWEMIATRFDPPLQIPE
ncbi:MAG: phytase, partial [Bacteroidota bacterium]